MTARKHPCCRKHWVGKKCIPCKRPATTMLVFANDVTRIDFVGHKGLVGRFDRWIGSLYCGPCASAAKRDAARLNFVVITPIWSTK